MGLKTGLKNELRQLRQTTPAENHRRSWRMGVRTTPTTPPYVIGGVGVVGVVHASAWDDKAIPGCLPRTTPVLA